LNTVFAKATEKGVKNVVLGMPHRGRLNTLVRLLNYPARDMFYKIAGKNDIPEELYTAIDDVVSHIAVSNKVAYRSIVNDVEVKSF
jgi:2-oxoglutarate dehydrogenase complex dehydrogenase (E1) component-like enzyme